MRVRPTHVVAVGLALAALLTVGLTSSGGGVPDITGTWQGTATFPLLDRTTGTTPETLVIDKQDGPLIWGTISYEDATGQVTNQLAGTFIQGGAGFVATEPESTWHGTVAGSTMTVTVEWLGNESHGAFEMTLTKE
jgi:hypothetical protein